VKRLLAGALLAGCAGPARLTEVERSRFLFMAVLEGLTEDGADPALLRPILDRADDHFVAKCPICMPVSHALRVYAGTPDVPLYQARGRGFPAELAEGLASGDRARRLRALEETVARYVARRFERVRMDASDRAELRALLEEGKKDGMSMLAPGFGDRCPSCAGATKPR
jgi:hypothetical protein